MLTVHHLRYSQSERIVWLCEELGIEYNLVAYDRDPDTRLAPAILKDVPGNSLGAAPLIQDGDLTLGESGAIAEYIAQKYGNGRFILPPGHPNYVEYLYWFHFSNAGLQPVLQMATIFRLAGTPDDNPVSGMFEWRGDRALHHLDQRLADVPYLAGNEITLADIMTVYTLTTARYFTLISLQPYPKILRYLQRISERPAYVATQLKADPGKVPLLGPASTDTPMI